MSKVLRVETFRGKDGQWYWREKAGNNRIVAEGGEGYKTRWGARLAASKFARQPEDSRMPLLIGLLFVLILLFFVWLFWHNSTASPVEHNQPQPVTKPVLPPQMTPAPPVDPAPVDDSNPIGK